VTTTPELEADYLGERLGPELRGQRHLAAYKVASSFSPGARARARSCQATRRGVASEAPARRCQGRADRA
jgi:hypothetical protein